MDNDVTKTVVEDIYGNIKSKSISGTLTRTALLNDAALAAKRENAESIFTVRGRFTDGSK